MNRLFLAIGAAALAAALSLSACVTSGTTPAAGTATSTASAAPAKSAQDIAADAFKTACTAVPLADLAFQAVRVFATNVIDDSAVKWEGIVYAGLQQRCAGPAPNIANYQAIVAEIEGDVGQVMAVVASAKNNPPPKPST